MLNRSEIDERINVLKSELAEEPRTENERKLAVLATLGLDLLGNLLGDISDIALNHRRQHIDILAYKAEHAAREAGK